MDSANFGFQNIIKNIQASTEQNGAQSSLKGTKEQKSTKNFCRESNEAEFLITLRSLKSGKAIGEVGIVLEKLRILAEELAPPLNELVKSIWAGRAKTPHGRNLLEIFRQIRR